MLRWLRVHDSLVSLLSPMRVNTRKSKSLDLPPPQWCNPIRRGHQPLRPIMSGLALRCSNLRLWSSHQASPSSSPHFLAMPPVSPLASPPRSPLLSGSSLPVSPCLPRFCSCVSLVCLSARASRLSPAPQSRARPGHDCIIFSTRLALPPDLRHGRPRQFQDPKGPRSQSKSHCLPVCFASSRN